MNRDTKYIFCHQWPLCVQDSDLDAKTTLPITNPHPPTLLPPPPHCTCLIAGIKRNDSFFYLSTGGKSNSVPQTGRSGLLGGTPRLTDRGPVGGFGAIRFQERLPRLLCLNKAEAVTRLLRARDTDPVVAPGPLPPT